MAETTAMADASSVASPSDGASLSDIATNGALLNQVVSELSQAVESLGQIVLPAVNGGTGLSSYAVGDLLFADTTTTLSKLPDVATGNALLSGGIGAPPSWGKVGLTTHVSGVLPIENGGTNRASFTPYAVICGGTTTTASLQSVASVGTAGQLLRSAGAGAIPAFTTLIITEAIGSMILAPENQDYVIGLNMPFAGTIVDFTTIATTGTCTLQVKINTTAVTGLTNAVSTSEVTTTASGSNVFAAGDDIRLTLSSNASCRNLSFMIKATRAV